MEIISDARGDETVAKIRFEALSGFRANILGATTMSFYTAWYREAAIRMGQ